MTGTDRHDPDRFGVAVELHWEHLGLVGLDETGKLKFPEATQQPGIYRFSFRAPDRDSAYIGEADQLRRRFAHYRNPGPTQRTNIAVNTLMKDVLGTGSVSVDIATEIRLEVEDQPVTSSLSNVFQRRLAENAALVAAQEAGRKIENRGGS
jgi:hypothetical protein